MRLPASPFASELVANLDSYPSATIASQTLTEDKAREVEHDARLVSCTRLPSFGPRTGQVGVVPDLFPYDSVTRPKRDPKAG